MEGCAHQDRGQTRNGKPNNGCINKMLTAEISENILISTSQHPRGEEHPVASPAMPRRVVEKPPGTAMGGGGNTEGTRAILTLLTNVMASHSFLLRQRAPTVLPSADKTVANGPGGVGETGSIERLVETVQNIREQQQWGRRRGEIPVTLAQSGQFDK